MELYNRPYLFAHNQEAPLLPRAEGLQSCVGYSAHSEPFAEVFAGAREMWVLRKGCQAAVCGSVNFC